MKKIINLIPLIVLLMLVVIGSLAIYKNHQQQLLNEKLTNNKVVSLPEFAFTDLYDGSKTLSNKDFNHKLSMLNVFASWCSTCKEEHQLLLELAATGAIDIYGIAFRDIDENTLRYLEKSGNPYIKVAADSKGILASSLSIKGVPESFIINKDGKILYRHQGNLTQNEIEYIEKLVREEKDK